MKLLKVSIVVITYNEEKPETSKVAPDTVRFPETDRAAFNVHVPLSNSKWL